MAAADDLTDNLTAEVPDTRPLLDTCPHCGEKQLAVWCNVPVLYRVSNDGRGCQDWEREYVDDDASAPFGVRCQGCETYWDAPEINAEGYLVGLGEE